MFDPANPIDTTQFLLGVASKGDFKWCFLDVEILFCVTEDISVFLHMRTALTGEGFIAVTAIAVVPLNVSRVHTNKMLTR